MLMNGFLDEILAWLQQLLDSKMSMSELFAQACVTTYNAE